MQELNNFSLHHIGYAVRSIKDAKIAFEAMGAKFFHESCDIERNLDFEFARMGTVMVELISPHDPKQPCTITNMIEKQPCTLYHTCLSVHDLESEVRRLRKTGFRQLGEVITTNLYGYKATGVFLFSPWMGVIELIQECKTDEG